MTEANGNSNQTAMSRRTVLGLAAGATAGVAAHAASREGNAEHRVNELVLMDATALSAAIHSRRASCVEVMDAYLDHIEKINPQVNAIVALKDREGLIAQARERDLQLARGESMGPLHGFPHAVKDLQNVKGIRTLRMLPVADGSDYGGSLRNPAGWNNVFGFRTSIGRIPYDAHDAWLPTMSVTGPMARNVSDLAMLLAVQAGFDSRVPLSLDGDGAMFQGRLERSFKGTRIAWGGDFKGHTPCEPGVLDVCRAAADTFESLGCVVEDAIPDFDLEAVWQAVMRLRSWQTGGTLLGYYNDPAKRALLKPEAVFEVETGVRQSAYDITNASVVRTEWSHAVSRFFERYDFLVVPTAQVFPFDVREHWPKEIAGQKMQTYHEWMKATMLVTMSGCPALAAPAGFNSHGLPIGIQIIAANRQELSCLQLAYAYESAMSLWDRRLPTLISRI